MKLGEDFGYLKDEEQNRLGIVAKKALLLGAVLFSIISFIYITINAYYFIYHDQENGVRMVKSPEGPIKIISKSDGENIKNIDKTIYDSIVGNSNLARDNLDDVKIVKKSQTPKAKEVIKENPKVVVGEMPPAKRSKKEPTNNNSIMVYQTDEAVKQISSSSDKSKYVPIKSNSVNKEPTRGLSRVQLVALTSRESAENYWSKLSETHPSLFNNLNHFISEVILGSKGTFYRLQIGDFRDQIDAEKFCHKFIFQAGKSKSDCIIVE
ncbi:MAG: hypothetical protein ACJA0S_001061 [Rickettsiales bacterium]|jgi:hypothetical protein